MAEEIHISGAGTKRERYEELLPQLQALVGDEKDLTANLANLAGALKQAFDFFWVGFYRVLGDQLVLGPYQGPIACTRIDFGRGVCGTAWKEKRVVLVEDVEKFPDHIACSSASKSEIVLPVFDSTGEVVLVLDVDSDRLGGFDPIDEEYLKRVMTLIEGLI